MGLARPIHSPFSPWHFCLRSWHWRRATSRRGAPCVSTPSSPCVTNKLANFVCPDLTLLLANPSYGITDVTCNPLCARVTETLRCVLCEWLVWSRRYRGHENAGAVRDGLLGCAHRDS